MCFLFLGFVRGRSGLESSAGALLLRGLEGGNGGSGCVPWRALVEGFDEEDWLDEPAACLADERVTLDDIRSARRRSHSRRQKAE